MNIAHLLPYTARFPLLKHNGRYEWVLRLAKLQTANGHQVTIYSSPESSGAGVQWESMTQGSGNRAEDNRNLILKAFSNNVHEIFHSHFDSLHYLVADQISKPIVFTQHWFPNQQISDASRLNKTGNVLAVPVTNYMREKNIELGLRTGQTIYHGIDLTLFKFRPKGKSDRLIFVGRISPNKGVKEAVQIAIDSNTKLDIVGKVNQSDAEYWKDVLKKVDGRQIRYLGPQSQPDVAELLGKARALLFPSQSPEAFGQTTIESQACGTPVIISDIGASSELVINNLTGFVAKTESDFIKSIEALDTIKASDCRKNAEQFDIHRMVKEYDKLYESLL